MFKRFSSVLVGLISAAFATAASAEDRDLAFLHALQTRGYGDTAVDYLEALTKNPDSPTAVKDVWDLEMSESLRAEAQTVGDRGAQAELLRKAQSYLDLFAKRNPNHPKALQAQLTNAAMIMDQASESLWAARATKDAAEKTAHLAEARKTLEQARPLLDKAVKNLKDRMAKLGPAPRGPNLSKKQRDLLADRLGLEGDLSQAQGRVALIDYYVAQTYTAKEEDGKRQTSLKSSEKALDDFYQEYRDRDPNSAEGRFALNAHSWHGKVEDELNRRDAAKEIYDEVLENFQDLSKDTKSIFPMDATSKGSQKYIKTGIDDILTRTKHFSLLLLAKDAKQQKEYLTRARDFVENEEYKKNLKMEWGYEAAALELAKHLVAAADKETKPSERDKLNHEALKIVGDMASLRNEFQREAIELRNKLSSGGAENPQTVAEARELASIAFEKKQWGEATQWLHKAQQLEEAKGSRKDPAQVSQIQEGLANAAMQPISEDYDLATKKGDFAKDKWNAWIEGSEKVAHEFKNTLVAQRAMGFALDCAAQLHRLAVDEEKAANARGGKEAAKAAAGDRVAALQRLNEAAAYTLSTYPGTGEADKARMSLARVNAMDGKYKEALEVYEAVEPSSDKYSEALDMAGRVRFSLYLLERNKQTADRNPKLMEEHREKAVQHFTESVAAAKKNLRIGDPIPSTLLETELVLAQIHLDAKEFKEAQDVVEPIVAALSAAIGRDNKTMQLDKTMLDIFSVAVRADLGLNEIKKAGEAGSILINIGPDKTDINAVLVNFALRLDVERRNVQETLNGLPDSTPPAEAEKIRDHLSSIKTMLGDMLTKLASRQEMTPQTLVYIGNLFNDLDMGNDAEQQYRSVLERANANPTFMKDKENARLLNAVRAKQISLLRKRGKFQEAADVADKLHTEFPDALEPLVERAKIYQDWALKDPAKYDDAIGGWTEIRLRLERSVPAGEPKNDRQRSLQQNYYDAVYNTAVCLLAQARGLKATDQAAAAKKAVTGEQVLNWVMKSHPKLDGAEATVKKFAAIKAQLAAFRGSQPAATPRVGDGASLDGRQRTQALGCARQLA